MTHPLPFVIEPTPIHLTPRLAGALGVHGDRLWIKRDDLIGLGGGGNKARKLQYSTAQAVERGAGVLVTTGAPQSNHARLTAAAGARLGLGVVLVLSGSPTELLGNLLLDRLFGATLVWSGSRDPEEKAGEVMQELESEGRRPHRIPFGGSDSSTAQGYADAAQEILDQVGDVDQIVVAVGSGGTMAGLVHRLGPERVRGVHCGAVDDARATVAALIAGMPGPDVDPSRLRLDLDQVGAGYAHITPSTIEAIRLFARTEGIVLDPTYTGRAAAGLVAAVAAGTIGRGERTVFLHSGGFPSVFAHPDQSW